MEIFKNFGGNSKNYLYNNSLNLYNSNSFNNNINNNIYNNYINNNYNNINKINNINNNININNNKNNCYKRGSDYYITNNNHSPLEKEKKELNNIYIPKKTLSNNFKNSYYYNYYIQFLKWLKVKDYSLIYNPLINKFLDYCLNNNINLFNININNHLAIINNYLLILKNKNYTNGTINNYIKAIKLFYKFCVEYNYLPEDFIDRVVSKLKLLKTERKIKDFFTKQELAYIVRMGQTFYTCMPPLRLKAVLYFLFYTGLRKSELVNLKRQDIDLEENTVIVRAPTKNKEERVVFFPDSIKELLKKYFDSEPERINAFNVTGPMLMHMTNALKRFAPSGKNFTLHSLRHSFANMLAKNMVDIRVAQKLLGHKQIENTMIYYDPDVEIIKEIYRKKIK